MTAGEVLDITLLTLRVGLVSTAIILLPGVALGLSLDELLAQAAVRKSVRCYIGYSGWGAGQLEAETVEGSWIVAPARAEHIFEVPAERLWASVLHELGGQYAWLALDSTPPSDN